MMSFSLNKAFRFYYSGEHFKKQYGNGISDQKWCICPAQSSIFIHETHHMSRTTNNFHLSVSSVFVLSMVEKKHRE